MCKQPPPFDGYYHWHQSCELLFVHEGSGTVVVEQREYDIRPGMLFIFRPFQIHKVFPDPNPEQPYIRSRVEFLPGVFSKHLGDTFPILQGVLNEIWRGTALAPAYELTGALLEQLEACCRSFGPFGQVEDEADEEDKILLLMHFLSAIRKAEGISGINKLRASATRVLRHSERVIDWLEARYAEEVSLDRMASELHLSKYYMSRVFREEMGGSIMDYLKSFRIKQACRLLQTTSLTVEQVGAAVGLPDASYFIQTFRKELDITPLQYRLSQ